MAAQAANRQTILLNFFFQSSGEWVREGKVIAKGYSGYGDGKNNPSMEAMQNVGPIPSGLWRIHEPHDSPVHGPFVLRLEAMPGTETHGRDGFLVHGDSSEHPGLASHGCIILPRTARTDIWNSGDRLLTVA